MMFDTYFSTGRQNRSTAFVPPFCVTIKNSVISAGIFRIVLDGLSSRRYFGQRSFDMENLRMESLKKQHTNGRVERVGKILAVLARIEIPNWPVARPFAFYDYSGFI